MHSRLYTTGHVFLTKTIKTTAILISYLIACGDAAAQTAAQPAPATPVPEGSTENALPDSVAAEDYTELDDFVIVQRKKVVESDGAKLTYNVTEDPESGSSNILDILRKVPGVTVDAEDNVKVNGQSNFKILMNGHDDPMLKGDLKSILKSLPAASIKKIEVISEPGAKYDAEGTGGILNIVTDRSRDLSGFMTQLSAWVNAYQAGGYLNARTKAGNVMIDATANYNNGRVWERAGRTERTYDYLDGGDNLRQEQHGRSKSGWDYTGANLNLSWEPDTLNLFTFGAQYGYNTWGSRTDETRTMFGPDMLKKWEVYRHTGYNGRYNGLGVQGSYQHNFKRDDHNLVLSYMFIYNHENQDNPITATDIEGSSGESPYSDNRMTGSTRQHVAQADYINKFDSHHTLEAGAKADISNNGSLNLPYFGSSEEESMLMDALKSDVTQFKDIYAVYASYTGSFDKLGIKGGVRYEHTRMGLRYRFGDMDDFTSRLNDIVPNAALSWNFSPASSLRLAYQMRVSRPGLWVLNPYVNTLTPGQISYGNPDLKSEKIHEASIGYTNYSGKFSGGVKLTYSYTGNWINDIIFMKDGLLNSTYANAGHRQSVQFDLNYDWNISNSLRWSVYSSTTWMEMKAKSELIRANRAGWQTYVNTQLNYTLPCSVRLSAYGGFFTPWLDLQSRGSNGYYYGLGASRSFLKDDALTVSLSVTNPLPVSRKYKYTQSDETVRAAYTGYNKQWNVGLSVSFRFGGLKSTVKKTAANIDAESNGGGGNSGDKGGK